MLSINKKKLIRLLQNKKQRDAQGLFIAEGIKLVGDLLRGGLQPHFIAAEASVLRQQPFANALCDKAECDPHDMKEVSALKTPSPILAIFRKPAEPQSLQPTDLTLVLDEVQDPGNLGTIIRVADWFGIRRIVCSTTCADAYGPKTIQATMGAIARVSIVETDLEQFFETNAREWHLPVCGTFLEGTDIYRTPLPQAALVVMGNEGKGISPRLARFVTCKLFIPPYPADAVTSESLNVATATAIVCSEFRRASR